MKELFTDVIPYISLVGGVILFILSWIRFRKKDAGTADKLKAEASVLLTDGALRIADRLSKDLDEARDEIDKLIVIAAELKEWHDKKTVTYMEETKQLLNKLKEARDLLEVKRKHCIEIKHRIITLQELLLVKESGLTHSQFEEFMVKVKQALDSKHEENNTDNSKIQ